MTPQTTSSVLLTAAAVGGVVGWAVVGLYENRGGVALVGWPTALLFAALAAIVVSLGWPVRQWTSGDKEKKQPLDPLYASRVLAFAQASSRAGALFLGWFVGHALHLLPDVAFEARRDRLIWVAVSVLTAALFTGAGVLVEKWCQVPPEDDLDADPA